MPTLRNKVALVTGASKGIGASIAKHLASAGATIIVNYACSKTDAERVVTAITDAGGTATAIQGDFSEPEEIAATFAEIKRSGMKLSQRNDLVFGCLMHRAKRSLIVLGIVGTKGVALGILDQVFGFKNCRFCGG